ncbi:MAG: pyridoxal phosphate-dependent aminotransferase [Alphaproteobacteria bacterium]
MTKGPVSVARDEPGFLARARRLERELDPYTPGLTREAAAERAGVAPSAIVKLSSNENPLGASPKAQAVVEAMRAELHEYPNSTADGLRAVIGRFHGVAPAQVVVGAGSSTLMHAIVAAFTEPGGEVISLDPSFTVYREIASIHGRVPVTVPLRKQDYLLDLDRFAAALTAKTQLVFLTRPNNPTSTLIPLADFEMASRLAAEKGALVVSDEAYIEFADRPDASAISLIRGAPRQPNVMVSRTFSKAFGLANLRLGYAIGTRETARGLALANAKWPTGAVAQKAGIAAMDDKEHLERSLRIVREGRASLTTFFNGMGLPVAPDPQGNYVMVDTAALGIDAASFAEKIFEAEHVLIRGDFSPRHVRVSIGTADENARLMDAVRRVVRQKG